MDWRKNRLFLAQRRTTGGVTWEMEPPRIGMELHRTVHFLQNFRREKGGVREPKGRKSNPTFYGKAYVPKPKVCALKGKAVHAKNKAKNIGLWSFIKQHPIKIKQKRGEIKKIT